MVRVLDGDRRWRKSVPFVKYLCGVMRSVASHWDEAADPALPASSLAYEDEEGEQLDPVTAAAGKEPDAEHVTLGRETLDVLVSHFENDEVASLLIMGLSEYRVSELPEMLGIAPEKCAAGMKRLRRHARALIDRGGRP
jgi:hypothetical protein